MMPPAALLPDPLPVAGRCATIVVAGGGGRRFGGPKQYERLGDARVLDYSLRTARIVSDLVVLVVPETFAERVEPEADLVVTGGLTRSASVRAGLAVVPDQFDIVIVHDAARPLASLDLFERVISAVSEGADAAVPGVSIVDTLRWRDGGRPAPDRDDLLAVQTPQAFRAKALRAVHDGGLEASDDASLVQAVGGAVRVIDGDPRNLKITEPLDLMIAEALLNTPEGFPNAVVWENGGASPRQESHVDEVRVGQGFDVHRFDTDSARPLILGGQHFEGNGLEAVSDGDVVAHACAEALLGATGLGDLGTHFPENAPASAGADSIEMLTTVATMVRGEGWKIGNIDCSVVTEVPKLAPRRDAMQQALSAAVGAPVSVKGRRAEGLGALGRTEGIACFASAVVVR